MARSSPSHLPPERLAAYDRVIATVQGVERKGAKIPYTSLNGHMFSYLSESGSLVLRLPAAERDAFLVRYGTTLHHAYGIVQKEYVDVPDALLDDTDEVARWFAAGHAHVAGLRPKPTTRRKP